MTRQTSIESYNQIKESGLLGARYQEIYEVLYQYGPLTANETFERIKLLYSRRFRHDSNTRARFTEMRELGVLMELGTRICTVTGRNVILWDVTGDLPVKIEEKKPDRLCYIFFPKGMNDTKPRVFKTKEAALKWRLESESHGNIYDAEWINK